MEVLGFLSEVLWTTAVALTVITLPVFLWQGIVMLHGLLPGGVSCRRQAKSAGSGGEEKIPLHRTARFAVVTCARNEEAVIGSLLDSLALQEYPRDCFDLFVVADNCTDATAAVARSYGAEVLERFDTLHIGKGHALRWALPQILPQGHRYDAVVLFDADNQASPAFLSEMDASLADGADVVQGYREAMNPADSWVSGCYGIYWLYMSRFFNRARANMGRSCLVGGTGFAFRTELVEETGWDTVTMSEDTEFSLQRICRGYRIVPADRAVFYDEQPTSFRVSLRQRYRWMTGCVQCVRRCLPEALQALRRGRRAPRPVETASVLDAVMLLLTPLAAVLALISGVLSALAILLEPGADPTGVGWLLLSGVGGLLALQAAAALTVRLERHSLRAFWRPILLFPVFILPLSYLILASLIRPKREWKPIAHTGGRKALERQ